MENIGNPEIEEAANRILKYINENPDAKDTASNICNWWMLQEKIDYTIKIVAEALNLLISKQLVIEKEITGSEKIYRINKSKKKEISKIVTLQNG